MEKALIRLLASVKDWVLLYGRGRAGIPIAEADEKWGNLMASIAEAERVVRG